MDEASCENGEISLGKIQYIKENGQYESFKIAFITLGCKVNRYETDGVRQMFEALGFQAVDEKELADVYVVNTCTVTAEADRKSGQLLRRAKKKNPKAVVAAMGCRVEMKEKEEAADVSTGTKNRALVVDLVLKRLRESYGAAFFQEEEDRSFFFPEKVVSQEETRAYIKIEDGCDAFCSYCIIPYARGRVKSRKKEDILKEAKALSEKGFSEVVITGIHLCSYGKDIGEDIFSVAEIVEEIARIDKIQRIRLGSLEPKSMTPDFILRLKNIKKLCPHFHLSLQSGSDSVLKRMNRRYTKKEFMEAVQLLKEIFPDCALTTDVIVAFPGETQREHEESLLFCEKMGFSRMHIFPYSERKGTKAVEIVPKVLPEVIEDRKKEFSELAWRLQEKYANSFLGKRSEVLLEEKRGDNQYAGYTKEYIRVYVSSSKALVSGAVYSVFLKKQKNGELFSDFSE